MLVGCSNEGEIQSTEPNTANYNTELPVTEVETATPIPNTTETTVEKNEEIMRIVGNRDWIITYNSDGMYVSIEQLDNNDDVVRGGFIRFMHERDSEYGSSDVVVGYSTGFSEDAVESTSVFIEGVTDDHKLTPADHLKLSESDVVQHYFIEQADN